MIPLRAPALGCLVKSVCSSSRGSRHGLIPACVARGRALSNPVSRAQGRLSDGGFLRRDVLHFSTPGTPKGRKHAGHVKNKGARGFTLTGRNMRLPWLSSGGCDRTGVPRNSSEFCPERIGRSIKNKHAGSKDSPVHARSCPIPVKLRNFATFHVVDRLHSTDSLFRGRKGRRESKRTRQEENERVNTYNTHRVKGATGGGNRKGE